MGNTAQTAVTEPVPVRLVRLRHSGVDGIHVIAVEAGKLSEQNPRQREGAAEGLADQHH